MDGTAATPLLYAMITSLAPHYQFDLETPFEELDPKPSVSACCMAQAKKGNTLSLSKRKRRTTLKKHAFEGIIPNLERRWRETHSSAVREELGKHRHLVIMPRVWWRAPVYRSPQCADGPGTSAGPGPGERRGRAIFEVEALSLSDCRQWFLDWVPDGAKKEIAHRIIQEIRARLDFLINVGLNYLSLDRGADTLSGGEAQRIRLASQIGSGLTGVMYVLDEPSIGLHQRDNHSLIKTLQQLRDLGNSVIVVEHDEDMIRAADFVLDMGPGAGEQGGCVVAQGTPDGNHGPTPSHSQVST